MEGKFINHDFDTSTRSLGTIIADYFARNRILKSRLSVVDPEGKTRCEVPFVIACAIAGFLNLFVVLFFVCDSIKPKPDTVIYIDCRRFAFKDVPLSMGGVISCICYGLRAVIVFLVGRIIDLFKLALFAVLFALSASLWLLMITLICSPLTIVYWTLTLRSFATSTASLRAELSLGQIPLVIFHLLDNLLILGPILY